MTGIIVVLAFGLYAEMTEGRGSKDPLPPWQAGFTILFAALVGYGAHALTTMFIERVLS